MSDKNLNQLLKKADEARSQVNYFTDAQLAYRLIARRGSKGFVRSAKEGQVYDQMACVAVQLKKDVLAGDTTHISLSIGAAKELRSQLNTAIEQYEFATRQDDIETRAREDAKAGLKPLMIWTAIVEWRLCGSNTVGGKEVIEREEVDLQIRSDDRTIAREAMKEELSRNYREGGKIISMGKRGNLSVYQL